MYRLHRAIPVLLCLCLSAGHALASEPEGRGGGALAEGFSEGFENVNDLVAQGWVEINNSQPLGLTDWGQGLVSEFPAHAGPPDSYIAANFNNAGGAGTISNWLLTPEIELRNGTRVEFWTRSTEDNDFPDRLEVRLSTAGDSFDVGLTALSTGDFGTLLLAINPDLDDDENYPSIWTRYALRLSGLPAGATGRVAFRYFVENSGPEGSNGDWIGIDSFRVEQPLFADRFEASASGTR